MGKCLLSCYHDWPCRVYPCHAGAHVALLYITHFGQHGTRHVLRSVCCISCAALLMLEVHLPIPCWSQVIPCHHAPCAVGLATTGDRCVLTRPCSCPCTRPSPSTSAGRLHPSPHPSPSSHDPFDPRPCSCSVLLWPPAVQEAEAV